MSKMHDLPLDEEKCDGISETAMENIVAMPAVVPDDALKYGEPYILRLQTSSRDAVISTASNEYVLISSVNPLAVTFTSDDGVDVGAPIRTQERLKIQSFHGILHGFDSSVWLAWSRSSERDGFMLDIPGRAAGAVVTLATAFTISSSYSDWQGSQVISFPGGKHLGLCSPGTRYTIWGVSAQVQFRAAQSTSNLVVRYDGEDIVFERVLPTMTVGAFKSRVANHFGVDMLKMTLMLKPYPTSKKGFLLSDHAMPLYKMQVGRGVLLLNLTITEAARRAPEVGVLTSDDIRQSAGMNMKIQDF